MGKYDGIVKYLGKEDSFTPDQIKQGIESHEKMESLNDMSGISQQDMANVDKLLGSPTSAPAGAPQATGDLHVDAEVLKEMEGLDAEPPNLEELQSRLQVTNYETPTEELMEEMTADDTTAEEVPAEDETPDLHILEPQFAKMEKEPPQEEIPLPPMLDDTFGLNENAGTGGDNVADLLNQLKPSEQTFPDKPAETFMPTEESQVPEAAFEIPPATTEPDLSSVFGPLEGSANQAPETAVEAPVEGAGKAPEDFAFDLPKMDETFPPAKDDFELPADFGMKEDTAVPPMDMKFDTSKLPRLDEEVMPGLPPETAGPKKKKEEIHDEFMDLQGEFEDTKKTKGVMPDILKTVKETKTTYGLDMDPDKAVRIRNKINKIVNPMLRKKVRYVFIEGKLPDKIMQQLIPMVLLGEEEQNIAELIDQYVPESVIREKEAPPQEKGAKPKRKIIHTEESLRAKDFQRDLQNITRYSFIIFFVVILLGVFFWKGVWTPFYAGKYYSQGTNAVRMEDYKTAEAKFDAGKSYGGPDNKWYNVFARAYEAKNQMEMARKKYREALENKPLDKETIRNYSHFYTIQNPPQYEFAIQLYKNLLKEFPNEFEYIDQSARIYIVWASNSVDTPQGELDKADRYKTADDLYGGYLIKHPKDIASYYQQLNIAIRVTNHERIDLIYNKIDDLNKGAVNDDILTALVTYYIGRRDVDSMALDKAKKVFEKLIGYGNTNAESYFQYARYLAINYDFTKAIRAVQTVTNLNPRLGKAYNLLGEIYYNNDTIPNNIILAKQMFETAVELSAGDFYKPMANLGNIYFYNNLNFTDSEKALENAFDYYKKAYLVYQRNGDRKDGNLLYNLGWLYYYFGFKQKDLDSVSMAQGLFDQLYQDDKSNPVLSYVMGNTYYSIYTLSGRKKNYNFLNLAKMQYSKAIEYYQAIADKINYINPNVDRHREVYGQLARCYNNRGVVDATYSRLDAFGKMDRSSDYEGQALLDFYKSKDSANKINSVYTFAEYNVKYILNKNMKSKKPAFDDELMKRTTLQKLIEELRLKMIKNI